MKKKMVGNVPGNVLGMLADLTHKLQHGVITQSQFGRFLQKQNPFDLILGSFSDQLESWRQFYLEEFDIELGEVKVPEQRSVFDRLIAVAKSITAQRVYDQCSKHFKCWKYTNKSLDNIVVNNDRDSQTAYVILVRDRVEADEELKNLSASQLKEKDIQGITLTERLLYGLKYYKETAKHLDVKNVTFCTGSHGDDGDVPSVGWGSGYREMYVDQFGPGDSGGGLRAREAVS